MFRHERQGNEVGGGSLLDEKQSAEVLVHLESLVLPSQIIHTCVKISFCVSNGRSRMVFWVGMVRLGSGAAMALAVAMIGGYLLLELSGSNPMRFKVRSQTSSCESFRTGVAVLRMTLTTCEGIATKRWTK